MKGGLHQDDEFKGNRVMTRHEYVAIIYRSLQKGVLVDADMGACDFRSKIKMAAEADQFRIDQIRLVVGIKIATKWSLSGSIMEIIRK